MVEPVAQDSATPSMTGGEFGKALTKLLEEVRAGVKHGFFECSITCEIVKDRKRRLVIKTGKNYQFTIPEEEATR